MAAKFSETVVNTVKELERERFRAMVEADGDQLDALLSDSVSYIHTNGKRESKAQFLTAITNGKRRYRQIEAESQDILLASDSMCIVTGKALVELEANTGAILFHIAYTAVQVLESDGWRLDHLRRQDVILAVGNGDQLVHQNRELSGKLWNKGVGNALREWDGFAHDWPVWHHMINRYIGGHD